jgi:uncharacterized protein YggE
MPRPPRTMLLTLAAVLAGAGASGIGTAQADSPTTTATPATIVVNGTDSITLAPDSPDATIQTTYQTALGDAITNASGKATFIATQIGATLGSVSNVTETSDSSNLCQGPILYAQGVATPGTSKSPTSSHKKKHKAGPMIRAIIDPTSTCTVEADVTVTYNITPA